MRITPLAAELRPRKLADVIGQQHLTDPGKPLARMVAKNRYQSTILWGPPGTGKTSLVRSLAHETNSNFCPLNATKATVKDLRSVISAAENGIEQERRTFVFVDEIHRWNKSQQDVMLPVVEDGIIVLFGATTEKPKFAVNPTLLSRCLILEVVALDAQAMITVILKVKEHYKTKGRKIDLDKDAAKTLIYRCSGDARKLIMALETAIEILSDTDHITLEHINEAIPDKHLVFDAHGNDHFDLAHCYQESIQNSDADAAIYWLAKWIESGEDPAYICRRLLITAFEDCAGNPLAAPMAMAACYTTERTGLPECVIPMALATCEMAKSKRNKTAYRAIKAALDDVRNGETVHVPPQLRAGTSGYFAAIRKKYLKGWERDVSALSADYE
jgi:putative ATPase